MGCKERTFKNKLLYPYRCGKGVFDYTDIISAEMAYTYASEADILNMALFGKTAAQWRSEKGIKGKMNFCHQM